MGIAPPQAPPALTRPQEQEGIDAVNRLVSTQHWLQSQQVSMPSPDAMQTRQHVDTYMTLLDAYWHAPTQGSRDARPLPRNQALARELGWAAGDLARLLAQDGNLDDTALAHIERLATPRDAASAPLAYELVVNGKPLAGTLVLQGEGLGNRVIVLTLDRGWRMSSSAQALFRDTEYQLRRNLARRSDLPGLAPLDASLALQGTSMHLQAIEGSPWQRMTDRLVALQKEKLEQARFASQVVPEAASGSVTPLDQMHDALRLDAMIDIEAMLTLRDKRLYLAHQAERLARVPPEVRTDWLSAAVAYRSAHRAAGGMMADRGMGEPMDLDAFMQHHEGHQASIGLYDAYLESLRSGKDGALRKELSAGLYHALMRTRAEDARLGYFLADQRQAFRDDHAQRGFLWVKAVLDSPSPEGRATVEGHLIVASQVVLGGQVADGLVAIGVRQERSVPTVLIYTPDAPDGLHFHEFDDWQDATHRFFHAPMFQDYLRDRLPGLTGSVDQATAERREMTGSMPDVLYDTAVDTLSRAAHSGTYALPDMISAPFRDPVPPWHEAHSSGQSLRNKRDLLTWLLRPFRRKPRWPAPTGAGMVTDTPGIVHLRTRDLAPAHFEPKFLASHVRRQGEPDSLGLYRIDGQAYIDHDGLLYGARYDEQMGVIRLRRPNAAPTAYGPAIQRMESNRWAHQRTGLLGGGDRPRPASYPPTNRTALQGRGTRYFRRLIAELEDAFPNHAQREAALVDLRARIGNPAYVRTLPLEHQQRLDFAVNRAAEVRPPRLPSEAAPAPPGYQALSDAEIPELVYTPWRAEGHFVQIRTFGGRPSTYLRMESDMVSATHQGITMRSTLGDPVSTDVQSYALRIRLRAAYGESIQAGQARFDVYRHLQNPDDLIVRPRDDLPLLLHSTEYEVALNPMRELPSLQQLLDE